jgi:LacI family transcriptional regulator
LPRPRDDADLSRRIGTAASKPPMFIEMLEYSTVHRLAKKMERDIRLRGLSPGDRYLTAVEAARNFGVSRTVANRAMFTLAKRGQLIRRRGHGTLIGPAMQMDPENNQQPRKRLLQSILLLETSDLIEIGVIRAEMMFPLLCRRFEHASLHLICLPEHDPARHVSHLIECSRQSGDRVGVIALSCTRPVYAYLADCGAPTVVIGSLYPDQREILPSVDFDYFEAGQLLVQSLVARGHQRLGLLLNSVGRAGSERLLNGVLAGMHAAGLSPADLTARFYPGNEQGFSAQVKGLLSMPNRPSAIIVGSEKMLRLVSTAAGDLGLSIPGQLDISYLSESSSVAKTLSCPCVQPQQSVDQMLGQVVEMLWQHAHGIPLSENTVTIPVSLQGVD